MLLIVQALIDGDYNAAKATLLIILAMWVLVAIAMIVDLLAGWNKAKQRGEARTSYGLRRTINKGVTYYQLMLFALIFDCISLFFLPLPYATFLITAFIIIIECKSVWEKANDKDKRRISENLGDLITLLDNRDDLIQGFTEIVKKELIKHKDESSFEDIYEKDR